jgi:hypothetical protein
LESVAARAFEAAHLNFAGPDLSSRANDIDGADLIHRKETAKLA